jgi:hypothetical protein
MWFDILKNQILVARQKLRSSSRPLPDEEDDDCRNKWIEICNALERFRWSSIIDDHNRERREKIMGESWMGYEQRFYKFDYPNFQDGYFTIYGEETKEKLPLRSGNPSITFLVEHNKNVEDIPDEVVCFALQYLEEIFFEGSFTGEKNLDGYKVKGFHEFERMGVIIAKPNQSVVRICWACSGERSTNLNTDAFTKQIEEVFRGVIR